MPRPLPSRLIPTVEQAKAWALAQLGPEQFACLDRIITYESHWDYLAWNGRGSGAYGLPQAWPASKMASAGDDWLTNPQTQLAWAIDYGRKKYGSLCSAAAYEFGWTDRDGTVHPGKGIW